MNAEEMNVETVEAIIIALQDQPIRGNDCYGFFKVLGGTCCKITISIQEVEDCDREDIYESY